MRSLRFSVVAFIALLSVTSTALGASLEELRQQGRLKTAVVVETPAPLYQRAPVVIAVEVATPRWFSRGTRVRDFRIPGAVVRPVSTFADNQSRRIDGETWSVQRWRFRVFANEDGALEIPTLRVSVSVSTAEYGVVDGELKVDSPALMIEAPPGTESLENWVAARDLTIDQFWEGELDVYEPGDALTLVRRYRIQDAPAMLLKGSAEPIIDGVAVYAAPPSVEDQSNRGRLSGIREERLVFTFERGGDYEIPGLTVHWFNTATAQIETINLDGRNVTVDGGGVTVIDNRPAKQRSITWILAAFFVAGLWALRGPIRRLPVVTRLERRFAQGRLESRQRREFCAAAARGDSERCVALLYGRLKPGAQVKLSAIVGGDTLNQLMAHAYGPASPMPPQAALMQLWQSLGAHRDGEGSEQVPALYLNPLPTGQRPD